MATIADQAMKIDVKKVPTFTQAYIYAANEAYGEPVFQCTLSNRDGRLFAGGEIGPDQWIFIDLEDEARTTYDLAAFKALDTDQDWLVLEPA